MPSWVDYNTMTLPFSLIEIQLKEKTVSLCSFGEPAPQASGGLPGGVSYPCSRAHYAGYAHACVQAGIRHWRLQLPPHQLTSPISLSLYTFLFYV